MSPRARVLAFCVTLVPFLARPVAAGWSAPTILGQVPGAQAVAANLALDGSAVIVVWGGPSPEPGGPPQTVVLRRSPDCGATWSEARPIPLPHSSSIVQTALAATHGRLHLAWRVYDPAGRHQVFHLRSLDGGRHWSRAQRLSPIGGSAESVSVAAGRDDVHVTWLDSRRRRPFLRSSRDGGVSWSPRRALGRRREGLTTPRVAVAGGLVHLAWGHAELLEDGWTGDIYHQLSADHGSSWTRPRRVNGTWGSAVTSLSATGSSTHLAWRYSEGYKSEDVYYSRARGPEPSWRGERQLNDPETDGAGGVLDSEGPLVGAVWIDTWSGFGQVMSRRSRDHGATWGPVKRLGRRASAPRIAVGPRREGTCGATYHVVFSRGAAGSSRIRYRRWSTADR